MEIEVALPTVEASEQLARNLAGVLSAGDLVVFEGDLGAGKTFIAGHVVWSLGAPRSLPVTSPTFTLVNEYDGKYPILHADLYRLGEPDELIELGLVDRIGRDAVVLVEWGDRFAEALGSQGLWVWLELTERGRSARITGRGPRGEQLLSALRAALVGGQLR